MGTRRSATGLSRIDYVLATPEAGTWPVRVHWRNTLTDHGALLAVAPQRAGQART